MSSMIVFLHIWYDLGRWFFQTSGENSRKSSMSSCDLILSCECTKKPPVAVMISGNCCLSHTPYLGKLSQGVMSIISGWLESVDWIESSSISWWLLDEKRLCLGDVILVEFTWGLEWLDGVSTLGEGVTWCCEVDGDLISLGNLAVVQEGECDDLWVELILDYWSF